jgi:proline iminopeptidase
MKKLTLLVYSLLFFNIANSQGILSFKTSDGESLFYTKTGNGPIIIFLSGGPGVSVNSMQLWADTLSTKFECILFDQRGTGLSTNVRLDSTTINLERATKDIDELRKHLGSEQISLCGISWGGGLSQAYASFYPNNVKKMVLVSTIGPDLTLFAAMGDNIWMRQYPNERDSLQYWNKQPSSPTSELRKGVFTYLPYLYDHNLGYYLGLDFLSKVSINSTMAELMWKDLVKNYDLKSRLINYKGQCIIIKPRQDVIPEEGCYLIKELIPQTKMISIERSGHMPHLENPKEFYPALKKAFSDNF